MAKKQIDLGLTGLDELFMDDKERAESRLPKIHEIPLSEIDEFPDHPFHVRLDEDMDQLVESIKERGIITPVTLRQKPDGRYEIVSGHRRTKACELAGLTTVKAEIKELSRDEAIILMVESNLQRTTILPSEKAFSYKMRLEAMNRQGQRTDLTSTPVVSKSRSNETLGEAGGESREQVRRYIRLTHLIEPLLDLVDSGKIAFRPAVELSYLTEEEQNSLGNFSFANGNGASFSKSGNTLTITKTGTISPSTVFSATRSLPSAENSTVSIYYSASSTYQTCVKLYSPQVETLRAYFKINVPNPGAIALVKTTEDGQNLSGWRFGVYSNAACTTLVSGPHTTDSSGKISITGLNAGTYYVKELGHSDSSISSRYTCSGDNPQKVSVSNGATATVSFYNKLAVGALEIRKSTNTGNHLDGWKFIVKKDGEEIPGSPFTTDETGIIRISDLAPGKYVVLESPTDDPYWTAELGYHTVTVEYGKTAVDQWLNKEQGLGYFTKSTNTGDEISGWHITVYADEACTQELHTLITGQDGTVCIYLEPGTYWVKETGSEDVRDDYWKMDDSVKQLVIRAHEKTTLEFVNNYSGRIAIRKSVEPEGTLEGWKFKITDVDGKEVSGSPFTTDKGGKILTGNLAPGDYTVEEMLPADSLYTGEAPKTVTVVAGKTAEVSFLNKLRAGRITIRKVDTNDVPLSGATFLLEGSEDGSLWYPVIPGSNGVCVLGERSEENLTTASKTSGEDGMLIWENLPTALQYRITETKAPEGYTLLKDYAFVAYGGALVCCRESRQYGHSGGKSQTPPGGAVAHGILHPGGYSAGKTAGFADISSNL